MNEDFYEREETPLGLTWNVTDFTELNMTLQIIWDKPTHISQHYVRDILELKIIDPTILMDDTGLTFRKRTVFTGRPPPQAILDETTDMLV